MVEPLGPSANASPVQPRGRAADGKRAGPAIEPSPEISHRSRWVCGVAQGLLQMLCGVEPWWTNQLAGDLSRAIYDADSFDRLQPDCHHAGLCMATEAGAVATGGQLSAAQPAAPLSMATGGQASAAQPATPPSVATGGQLSAAQPAAPPAQRSMLQQTLRRSCLEPRPPPEPRRGTHVSRCAARAASHKRGRPEPGCPGKSATLISIESHLLLGERPRLSSIERSWQEKRRCAVLLDSNACPQ